MDTKEALEGKPLRLPLHVVIVHLPIGLFVLSLLLDIGSYLSRRSVDLPRSSFYVLALGLITAVLAAVPGLVDYTSIRTDQPAKRIAIWHMILNLAAVIVYAISLGFRWQNLDAVHTGGTAFILSIVGIILIGISGYLGGILVYDEGVGVGRHRRPNGAIPPTLHGDLATIDASGYVAVGSSDLLKEDGQIIRADVGGTVVAIARMNGQLRAFQEFCTHRCGPLSEGCIVDGQIQCPWHNSRFDVSTGKVTHGPAKVELKAFDAEFRDGQIWVNTAERKSLRRPQAPLGTTDRPEDSATKVNPEIGSNKTVADRAPNDY